MGGRWENWLEDGGWGEQGLPRGPLLHPQQGQVSESYSLQTGKAAPWKVEREGQVLPSTA